MNEDRAILELLKLTEEIDRLKDTNKQQFWMPLPRQKDFLDATAKSKALTAGNQCGKSTSLAFEESCHLTGIYPDWWVGVRYDRPVDIWMVGPTTLRVRDTLQVQLFGSLGEMGTGMIPKDRIIRTVARPGIPECIDKGYVKHVSGGQSSVQFFSYEMGREKFQGSTIDRVLLDEEPPEGIYGECKMRVGVKDGYIVFTFTPLSGMTPMMNAILNDDHIVKFSIAMDDCPWWTPEKIERQLSGLSDHEKNARRYGIPAASGGTIFQFSEEEYACQSFEIPNYWPRIGGLDIGINHPTAAVSVAIDPDDNTLYVYQEYGATGEAPAKHAMTLKHWRIPFALSHDAFNRSSGTGNTTAKIYEEEGIRAFNAGRDLWGHINHIRNLICEGKLWIFKDKCPNLLKEMKMYRTKDNNPDQVVDKDDDYVAALRHATFHSDKAEIIGRRKTIDVTVKQWEPFDKGLGV